MIRVGYFSLSTKIVFQVLTGTDINGFPVPNPNEAYALLLNEELSMPLYFDGTQFQPLPAKPDDGHIWDPITCAWIGDISATAWAREELMELQAAYYLERGFRITFRGGLHRFPCTVRNGGRIRDAAMLAAQTAPSDPFSFHIESSTTAFNVTRSEALALHQELCVHSNAVDQERMRIVDAIVAAFALAETDLAAGLAAMMDIAWTYLP